MLAEYCSGLICASLIHLKPLVKMLLPFLLEDTPKTSRDIEPALPRLRDRTYSQLSRRFEIQYGRLSRSWIAASSRSDGHGGTTEVNEMVEVMPQLEFEDDYDGLPRSPQKVWTWAPKDYDKPEPILLRHVSPV